MNQYHSYIDKGFINNIDDLIGSPAHDSNDNHRLVGDYYIVDFNGDGVVDSKDSAPVGYSSSPQNTYNATIGFEWKGFSAFAQFYGVTNVTRDVGLGSLVISLIMFMILVLGGIRIKPMQNVSSLVGVPLLQVTPMVHNICMMALTFV